MNHEVHPKEADLQRARQAVDTAVKTWQHAVEVEEAEFTLGWQRFERPVSVVATEDEINLVFNVGADWSEEVTDAVLRALLEKEYLEKAEFDGIEFAWQEIAQMAYVKRREADIKDEDLESQPLETEWERIMSESGNIRPEELYENAAALSYAVARDRNADELLEIKRSDVMESLEGEFG